MAARRDTCKAVMLRKEKCLSHFLDSELWSDGGMIMMRTEVHSTFQTPGLALQGKGASLPNENKGFNCYGWLKGDDDQSVSACDHGIPDSRVSGRTLPTSGGYLLCFHHSSKPTTRPSPTVASMNGRARGIAIHARTTIPIETIAPARVPGTDTLPKAPREAGRCLCVL